MFSDQTAAFSPSILDFTQPEFRHVGAGPGPRSALGAPDARATQLLLNNCHNGGEPLATLCLI